MTRNVLLTFNNQSKFLKKDGFPQVGFEPTTNQLITKHYNKHLELSLNGIISFNQAMLVSFHPFAYHEQ
jgi:hypothetical protein